MPQSHPASQALLSFLLNDVQDYAIFMMDMQGTITTWMPGVRHVLGYEETEFVGQHASLIFPLDAPKALDRELKQAAKVGRAEDTRWLRHKDGTLFWANGQLVALRTEEGELCGYAKILRDETRQKEVEDELKTTREHLETALKVGKIGTWVWSIPDNHVVADATLARMFGVPAEDASGGPLEHYIQAVHPDDFQAISDAIGDSIKTLGSYSCDYRIIQPNGNVIWVEARGKVEPDTKGNPSHLNGVVLDISDRKKAEDAFRQSEERYRTLFEAIDNGFCVIEMIFDENNTPIDYLFLEVNPTFEKQTGLKNAVGKTARELVPGLNEFWFQTYGKVALTGESIHLEDHAEAMGRWFDVHAFRVGVPEARRVAVLFTDISEAKHAEESLRAAHSQAEAANRLKDEFLATLSHELRTPLNAILGWANLLRTNQLDIDIQNKGLETIERSARSQSQLINDLLDVSRILTGKLRLEMRPVEVSEPVESAVNTVLPSAQAKGISIQTTLDRSLGHIAGDMDRLSQIFWNLLSNAVKFTPSGGHIEVTMRSSESGVQVRIADSGQGIAPEFLPFVFERFRQADASSTRSHGGLGIGLALVRHLMEAHGGTVGVESQGEGRGSTFTVTFPLSTAHSMPAMSPVSEPEQIKDTALDDTIALPPLSGLRILVVDDEADARSLVSITLKQRGAEVNVADSAATAFASINESRDNQKPFDVLVSDIGMPGEDGHGLIRRIRRDEEQAGGFLPAIALTAYATHKDRMNALLAGFQIHIPKPIEPAELVATIASLTGRTGHSN